MGVSKNQGHLKRVHNINRISNTKTPNGTPNVSKLLYRTIVFPSSSVTDLIGPRTVSNIYIYIYMV